MKIAIVSPMMIPVPPKTYGGIQLIVYELAQGLAERGHQVTVFCSGDSTIEGENIVRVESSPYPTSQHFGENRTWEKKQLADVLKKEDEFDIIHFHYEPAVFRFRTDSEEIDFSESFSVPLVFTFHNSTSVPEHLEYYQKNTKLQKHSFVFVSKNQRKPLSFFPNSKVIYNALPLGQFPFSKEKENYLLFLGRITPSKGISEAITVSQRTNVPLIIAARIDPVDREFYEKEVRPHIDGELIRYVGEADFFQKTEYLKKAKCLLFPILWEEPFGLVMTEALVCGTPVIAFRRGSVPEIIQDGVNGFIVNDIDEMAEAISKVGTISADKCRESMEGRFSVKRMVDEYESVFEKLNNK